MVSVVWTHSLIAFGYLSFPGDCIWDAYGVRVSDLATQKAETLLASDYCNNSDDSNLSDVTYGVRDLHSDGRDVIAGRKFCYLHHSCRPQTDNFEEGKRESAI